MSNAARTRLGPYELNSPLGAGGMGEVFRARDTRLNRDVAVKVLPKDFVADADRLRRFEQEAKTLAALNHPNILTIHDAGLHEGAPYLVSELLEGRTLREEMSGVVLPVRKATDYALQIAQGLAAAHSKSVIHRDLKPENLFVTQDGRVKILDFGLAKLKAPSPDLRPPSPHPMGPMGRGQGEGQLENPDALTLVQPAAETTEPGRVMGTPSYMAPEQVRGESVDHRVDIFAFGCVLYEMLSGQRPFKRDTSIATMAAIMNDEPPDLLVTKPDLPPALARVIHRCLEKNPENRFQTAKDLAFAVEAASVSNAVPRPTPWGSSRPEEAQTSKSEIRNLKSEIERSLVTSAATRFGWVAVLVLLVGGIGWWLVQKQRNSATPTNGAPGAARSASRGHITSLAVKPLDDFSGDTNNAYLSDGMTEALCAALGNVSSLRVPGRSSVMRFKGGQKSISEMARELKVDAVVEGSIQRAGSRMMITVQLIEAATDRHLWATNYQRDLSDFFTVQSEVARAIASEVQVRLTPEDQARLARAHPANREAIEACLLGMHHLWKVSDEGFANALKHFQRAIQIDPNHALGYAGAALAYGQGAGWWLWSSMEAMPKARAMAQRAIDLDPALAEGYLARGNIRLNFDWDWAGAESDFKQAIELRPSSSQALDYYATFLLARDQTDEAIAIMKRALELDPLSPALHSDLGWAYFYAGRHDRAIPSFYQALDLDRNFFQAHYWLGWSLEGIGKKAEALAEFQTLLKIDPNSAMARVGLGLMFAVTGQRAEALKVIEDLDRLATRRYVSRCSYALIYLNLGQKETALDLLEKAYQERNPEMAYLKVDLGKTSLQNEPRFQALVKKVENGGREK